MFGTKRKLEKLKDEFAQYKYDQENKPKYIVGQKLSDGSVITKVEKINNGFNFGENFHITYTWRYECCKDGKITLQLNPTHIEFNINDFKTLSIKLNEQQSLISRLQWQINNPAKYKIGTIYKGIGKCTNVEVEEKSTNILFPQYKINFYRYTFTKNNQTITINE